MAWVVDTCVLIDVFEADPQFGESSARLLDEQAADGLVISPVTYVELAPAFEGRLDLQEEFLRGIGVDFHQSWTSRDSQVAHAAWNEHIRRKRRGRVPKRPLADLLIGAFAMRFQGLLTRNVADFRTSFPELVLRSS